MRRQAQRVCTNRVAALLCSLTVGVLLLGATGAEGQSARLLTQSSKNKPLPSLAQAAIEARARTPQPKGPFHEVPRFTKGFSRTQTGGHGPDEVLQESAGSGPTTVLPASFDGADNDDNQQVVGFRVAPPDTNADVGPNHIVQMVNLVTTIYDKSGQVLAGPFPNNAFWFGAGGLCAPNNQGDPVVLYDDRNDRWLVSQFAFDDALTHFAQCVAISQTGDPTGAYNRYEWSFDGIGLPDYPKFGIVNDSITMTANLFTPFLFGFLFSGTHLAVFDLSKMLVGDPAYMLFANVGTNEVGFVPGDLDGAGQAPALFATAMSRSQRFDVWRIDPDWTATPPTGTIGRIAEIPISAYDSDLCSASREACIPQPSPGSALEALSDRLMHRLQIRDFGTHRSMVAAHTVDVGSGRAGIRWYEMRDSGSGWTKYQEATYGPNDSLNRWMPSIAMNAAGDIGVGYLLSSSTTYLSIAVSGQSVSSSGTGTLDAAEALCQGGSGAQTQTARAGDYSATVVDPVSDTFWHSNEYGRVTGSFEWATRVCEFEISEDGGAPPPPPPPSATKMHVESIVTGFLGVGRGQKRASATVTILDDLGNPVSGATVAGTFSGDFEGSPEDITGADGTVTLFSTDTHKGKVSFSFCVTAVTGALEYDPSQNTNPDFSCQ